MLGDRVMPEVVKTLRLTPSERKPPYLLRRWNAPAISPGTATAWKDLPLTQSQASSATQAVMKAGLGSETPDWKDRPLPSYVARRLPTSLAGTMGMSALLRGNLGNWRNIKDKDVKDESVSMALRYDALKTQGNLQAKLMVSQCLYQAVTSADSCNLPLRELTCHFPPIAELEQWALERVTDVVPQDGDAASRLQSIQIVETPRMVKATLAKLLGSSEEAAIAAESDGEKGSDSDGTALSDDETAGPLALRVGGTQMFFTNKVNSGPIHLLNEDTSDGQYCYSAKTCNIQVAFHNATRSPAWRMLSVQRKFCTRCRASFSEELRAFLFPSNSE